MIPSEVLIALGKPAYIQLLTNVKERRVLIRPLSSNIEHSFDVPDLLYEGNVLAFPGSELITGTKKALGWKDDYLYAAECRLVQDTDENTLILADLNTAKPSEPIDCPVVIPKRFD